MAVPLTNIELHRKVTREFRMHHKGTIFKEDGMKTIISLRGIKIECSFDPVYNLWNVNNKKLTHKKFVNEYYEKNVCNKTLIMSYFFDFALKNKLKIGQNNDLISIGNLLFDISDWYCYVYDKTFNIVHSCDCLSLLTFQSNMKYFY
jgi:hypothetical protein